MTFPNDDDLVPVMTETEATEKYLENYHKENPSCTSRTFAFGQSSRSLSSYEEVVEKTLQVKPPGPLLDLACGDGFLLKTFVEKGSRAGDLYGIDLSESELNLARKLPSLHQEQLFLGNARALPFPANFFAAITCHMAFMLMPDAESVVSEIQRVLKPGGCFIALVPSDKRHGLAGKYFSDRIAHYLSFEKDLPKIKFWDDRTLTIEGLKSLFTEGFLPPEIINTTFKYAFTPLETVNSYFDTYRIPWLSTKGQQDLREDLLSKFTEMAEENGKVADHIVTWIITVTKQS